MHLTAAMAVLPFVLKLSDLEITQVPSFVRHAWGNQAPAVTLPEVSRLRDRQTH